MSNGAAKDPPKDVAPPLVAGPRPIGDGRGQAPDVIGDDAVGHVHRVLQRAAVVPCVGVRRDRVEYGRKEIDVVVAVLVLKHADQPLQTHAGVDVLRRKRRERSGGIAIELDEDEVPQLDDARVPGVDQRAAGPIAGEVVMDFAARSAWTGGAHFPKVVLFGPATDPLGRDVLLPDLLRLGVRL